MVARLRERRSALAVWSWRFSIVSVPILVIAAIGHHGGLMSATQAFAAMALGFSFAGFGVIAAIGALEAIWRDGRKGLGPAIRGLILGLLVLVVPALGAVRLVTHPRLHDISTDLDDPPAFVLALADRPGDAQPLSDSDDDAIALHEDSYPDIVSRHYPVGPARVFDDASTLVSQRGWRLLGGQRPEEGVPIGRIEAVASTTVFGFRHDVVIRIEADGEGTLFDMRSAARNGAHDLGVNADRIRAFLRDLDAALQGISEE
ncbi:MAG: DUF1499 domain-containing protein [Hyphomicrobiales bacterium]|nr:DUF1499 domain-containing protein [Hyphomicrobiales bacterium]